MNAEEIEQHYEDIILPQYGFAEGSIKWKDHGKIDEDVFSHNFESEGTSYMLVFEDFPSAAHHITADNERVLTTDGAERINNSLEEYITADDYIENITGYFSLYKEK